MPDLFSVPIFFILFRETVEAAIIVSVLLALINKISASSPSFKLLSWKLKRQVWVGTVSGLLLSLSIGAVFLFIWFKYAVDLWAMAESLWEGIFSIIASVMVAVTSLAMLKGSRMYEKYSVKLASKLGALPIAEDQVTDGNDIIPSTANSTEGDSALLYRNGRDPLNVSGRNSQGSTSTAFNQLPGSAAAQGSKFTIGDEEELPSNVGASGAVLATRDSYSAVTAHDEDDIVPARSSLGLSALDKQTESLKQPLKALFWLPFITMLREGLESVVFIGGVAMTESASSIPLAVLAGIAVGVVIGFLIHSGGSRLTLHWFFVVSACFLLLISDGLLVKAIGNFEDYTWSKTINLEADDVGTGAFDPRINVWHFDCCSPEDKTQGWGVFNSVLGWRNNASVFTITTYCLFWVLTSAILGFMRIKEDRQRAHQKELEQRRRFAGEEEEIAAAIAR
ncbi:hypothetical protein BASA50_001252 [Batrachochytrium salamandrivorans]|uniref:FTR1 family protein n=1 Tax=Batrachochytrium salamandrivorans TaxID=1357716 RepID=A0ABQ8EW36_9FUNG|nr:hypothetical protein BASA62_004121 [Batrachochytrium salamandrivorans]KAH6587323.1 hypothetical protein BASA50_001252 [Batrachochytrium salamandrivorans]KAH6588759.1 hypothetical protein BASA61_005823 [Batrachochytrium salamandrivorans]KAH9250782.1 hypothetical protein BASA81_011370 [Batrachochytrium salamandrivorans]KAH9267274.1 hypothetical protein BASA83_010007 [Batrachochytrium salamandrivorans]